MTAALDSNANNWAPPSAQNGSILPGDLREWRWNLRDGLRSISTLERVRKCGRVPIAETIGLRLTGDGEHAGYAGLATCGSVWACPTCSGKVMTRRGVEIAAAISWGFEHGYRVVMATATVRHHAGLPLSELIPAVMHGWRRVTNGKSWKLDRERIGLVGWVRSLEILHNRRNGWHPHIHALFIVRDDFSRSDTEEFGKRLFTRWLAGLNRHGFDAEPIGQRVDLITRDTPAERLGTYLTKAGLPAADALGYEMTSTASKTGRSIGRTQWELAAGAVAKTGRDRLHWANFEFATHGRRQLGWSRGLRDLAGVGREETDEDIAAEETGTDDDSIGYLTRTGWGELCRTPGLPVVLLRVAEQGGWPQVAAVLDEYGIEYVEAERQRENGHRQD